MSYPDGSFMSAPPMLERHRLRFVWGQAMTRPFSPRQASETFVAIPRSRLVRARDLGAVPEAEALSRASPRAINAALSVELSGGLSGCILVRVESSFRERVKALGTFPLRKSSPPARAVLFSALASAGSAPKTAAAFGGAGFSLPLRAASVA